jgi:hypothetical protein
MGRTPSAQTLFLNFLFTDVNEVINVPVLHECDKPVWSRQLQARMSSGRKTNRLDKFTKQLPEAPTPGWFRKVNSLRQGRPSENEGDARWLLQYLQLACISFNFHRQNRRCFHSLNHHVVEDCNSNMKYSYAVRG